MFPHVEIADVPAREVTAHQVAALVRRVREAGKERADGILRSYLSAAYNAAKRAPFDSALPADLIAFNVEHNPVDAIPAIPVRRGDRTLSAAELRAYTRAQLLSHGISGVQAAHYDRHAYSDEKRAALVAWEARLSAIQKGERTPANVVQLHAA